MIRFLKFLEAKENLDPKEYIYEYNGTWIIRSGHTKDRFDDPKRIVPKKKKKELFKKAIKYCQSEGKKNQCYVFFVKKTDVGMVIDFREDVRKQVKGNHLIIVTWIGNVTHSPISKTIHNFKLKYKTDIRKILEQIGADLNNIKFVEL